MSKPDLKRCINVPRLTGERRVLLMSSVIACICLCAIGFIWAYYSSTFRVQNTLSTNTSGVAIYEVFAPADQWLAGETKQKEVSFANIGQTDQLIRFLVTEQWAVVDQDDTVFAADATAATINWTAAIFGEDEAAEWWYNEADGYYYYNAVLAAGAQTNAVISSIAVSGDISNGSDYASNVLDYSDKTYSLTITMEALPVNEEAVLSAWGITVEINETEQSVSWSSNDALADS